MSFQQQRPLYSKTPSSSSKPLWVAPGGGAGPNVHILWIWITRDDDDDDDEGDDDDEDVLPLLSESIVLQIFDIFQYY